MVNPARAGMILNLFFKQKEKVSKPRASGDDPNFRGVNANIQA